MHNIEEKNLNNNNNNKNVALHLQSLFAHIKNILYLPGFVFKMQPLVFNVCATHISHTNINMQLSTDHK